ncbi:hypothetical protein AWC38_SpisGene13312 [Stylophora pistillata]|uniref:Uncharacterized protein n=1 Tax=Stylophora pistillata TaxID=50429 RepID=A0A2B4RYD7_STYPI|nr:hypothetical protein AWC38_SpisGene13312 [Stylophora pistillata]
MEIEDVQMQIQSYLCQLRVKDLEEMAKTVGCSEEDTKEKNRKGLVRLIEEQLEGTLKGTKAAKMKHLEEFKLQIMEYTPVCPPLEVVDEETKPRISQPLLGEVDTGLQDEAIRTRLRPSLQNPNVQDEDLIQKMNEIVLEETERKSKLGSSTRQRRVEDRGKHSELNCPLGLAAGSTPTTEILFK